MDKLYFFIVCFNVGNGNIPPLFSVILRDMTYSLMRVFPKITELWHFVVAFSFVYFSSFVDMGLSIFQCK
jgi:hypothetical protein